MSDDGIYDNFAQSSQRFSNSHIDGADFGIQSDDEDASDAVDVIPYNSISESHDIYDEPAVQTEEQREKKAKAFSALAKRHATDLKPRNLTDPGNLKMHGFEGFERFAHESDDESDVEPSPRQSMKSRKPSRNNGPLTNPSSFKRQGTAKSFKLKKDKVKFQEPPKKEELPKEEPKKLEPPAKMDLPAHQPRDPAPTFYIMYHDPCDADVAKKLADALELNVESPNEDDVSVFFDLVTLKAMRLASGKWRKTAVTERLHQIRSAEIYIILFSEASVAAMQKAHEEDSTFLLEMELALKSIQVVVPAFIGYNGTPFRGINLSTIADTPAFNAFTKDTPKATLTKLLERPCLKVPDRFSNDELREAVFSFEDILKGDLFEAEPGSKDFLTDSDFTPAFDATVQASAPQEETPALESQISSMSVMSNDEDEYDQDPESIQWSHWELAKTQVEILTKIGEGEFGEVSSGKLHGIGDNEGMVAKVAIKQLKPGSKPGAKAEFLREAHFMVQLHHRNLVNIYGVITVEEPVLIVSELCTHGALKSYLASNRYASGAVSLQTCQEMIIDICSGMEFVADENFIHRDLAARNVLVEKQSNGIRCKVADLGLAVRCTEEYHQGDITQPVPIRWSAPEAIRRGHFSVYSDVWSFGIVMYEIVTFGNDPYDGVSNREVVQMVCDQGVRLPCPKSSLRGCPQSWHDIMVRCWSQFPEDRPDFTALLEQFEAAPLN